MGIVERHLPLDDSRAKRSVIFRFSLAPRNALRSVKFVVSTTSVLPHTSRARISEIQM